MSKEFLGEVIRLLNAASVGYGETRGIYSFEQAYREGLTAEHAVSDCLSYFDAEGVR